MKKKKLKPIKLTGKKLIVYDAMIKSLGNVTQSCKKAGIDRTTYYYWLDTDKEFKKAMKDLGEYQLDFYETALNSLIQDKNPIAVIFALKCKGKERGWIEKNELEINTFENKIINVEIEKRVNEILNIENNESKSIGYKEDLDHDQR